MKIIQIALFILICFSKTDAQDYSKEGIIKTNDGILLYNNEAKESYHLQLRGKIEIKSFPLVILNSKAFQLNKGPKSNFGDNDDSILTNYQKWEHEYLEHDIFKMKIPLSQKRFIHKNTLVDLWYFNMPKIPGKSPVLKTYYLDFIHGETVYSFSYSSLLGEDKDARDFLLNLFDSMHFYNKSIDLNSIREKIISGKNF
jgi:hypothetical protein